LKNGDWGLGPIPNPQSPIPNLFFLIIWKNISISIEILIDKKIIKIKN